MRLAPIVTLAFFVCGEVEYAAAASIVPGDTLLGAACTSRFRLFPTCRCERCSVPASDTTSGVYSELWLPSTPSWLSVSCFLNSVSFIEGGSGFEGMRQVRGASLWM